MTPNENNSDPKKNLWSQILYDVRNHGNAKLPAFKQILVLGNNESGKTTMVAKLQGAENPKKGSGLEYAYINVRDDYREDQTKLSVWVLDGDPGHNPLLKFALNENTFEDTLVVLTVTMTAPWGILEQLQHWVSVLADHLDKLNLNADIRQARKQYLVRKWLEYIEPGDDLEATSPLGRSARNLSDSTDFDETEGTFALSDGALSKNLGLDMVVVVTKTDYIQILEKEYDYRDEHLDFIQQWIRRFCLHYGAALFYTSAKEDKNCDLLYKYLTHRIYNFPFRTPALVVEKDAVFIPAGWDNLKKISILYENLHSCKHDDYFRNVIVPPITRKTISREVELVAEDEQAFLLKQQQILFAGNVAPVGSRPNITDGPLRASPIPKSTLDGSKVVSTPGGEGVLANFFNSLLHKKPGSSPGNASISSNKSVNSSGVDPLGDKATIRSDAAAELDRLARGKKPTFVNISKSDFNSSSDC